MNFFILIAFAFAFSFAKQYGVYDVQGVRILTFEAESHELPEKTQQIRSAYPNRSLYISSLRKGKDSRPTSRYRYKAETNAYIEASRKETFSICPDKEIQGTWISEHLVALNAENCISVQTPSLAGTIRVQFLQNSGRTDTIQVLVEQSYIQMEDYLHKVWVEVPLPWFCRDGNTCTESDYGHYENKRYNQALIVDKTEFTMGDAWHYSELGINLNKWTVDPHYQPEGITIIGGPTKEHYPPNEDLKTSIRPYIESGGTIWRFANMRSKLEGLDTIYSFDRDMFIDTSTFGYRMPYKDEWAMLMRAGASTRYYWGNEEDSLIVSRYAWVRPVGYTQHKVAQKLPNAFGLYDMINPNNINGATSPICTTSPFHNQMPECRFLAGKVARQVESGMKICLVEINNASSSEKCQKFTSDFNATSTRLLRKTPKLHKLEKL
ncbi:MAG: formylglycine-generating enzyme family protein [Fibromonadaceae bacterium]|nr:formylglycine-generating enzyme family protein [Fibromonadaceae bacterium]